MALVPIKLRPGVTTQPTPLLNEGGWSSSKNVRWKDGLPEKNGGYVQFTKTLPTSGVPLALLAWSSLSNQSLLAIACANRLNIFLAENVSDITPLTISALVPISLSTTSGSQVVVINDSVNMPVVGEWLQIRDPVSVDGIVLLGSYGVTAVTPGVSYSITAALQGSTTVVAGGNVRQFNSTAGSTTIVVFFPDHGLFTGEVTSIPDIIMVGGIALQGNYLATVVDSTHYTITAASPALSTASVEENGGNVQITFFNPASGGLSQGINASAATMANWGEFLMVCWRGGPIYVWMPAKGTTSLAMNIATAPQSVGVIFVATQEQMLFALGSVNQATGLFDPMLVSWSDAGDYTDFIPTVTNQAGSFRLSAGSKIIGGLALAAGNLIWTDLALFSAQYLQPPLVWGFQPIALNCGLVGPHAFGTLGQNLFWMSQRQFYFMSAGSAPSVLPCAVWDVVFKNMDLANLDSVVCKTNSFFNEVSWEVPQSDGTVTDARIQIDLGLWDFTIRSPGMADAPRRAWIDQSVFGAPIAADATGVVWQHETGKNAGTAPLPWSLTSGEIMIAEGDQISFFREIKPEFKFSETGPGPGVVQCTIFVYGDPQDPPKVKGPFMITDKTRSIPGARGRGRALQFEFSGNDTNSWVRGGLVRYRVSSDGRR